MGKIKLYYSSAVEAPWCDLGKIRDLLSSLKEEGVPVQEKNTAVMPPGELKELYTSTIVPASVRNKYKISGIFGTRRDSGCFFGREQPGLAVFVKDAEVATDVYPHDEDGRRIMIADYLSERLSGLKKKD